MSSRLSGIITSACLQPRDEHGRSSGVIPRDRPIGTLDDPLVTKPLCSTSHVSASGGSADFRYHPDWRCQLSTHTTFFRCHVTFSQNCFKMGFSTTFLRQRQLFTNNVRNCKLYLLICIAHRAISPHHGGHHVSVSMQHIKICEMANHDRQANYARYSPVTQYARPVPLFSEWYISPM
jgi:hypothetical protein